MRIQCEFGCIAVHVQTAFVVVWAWPGCQSRHSENLVFVPGVVHWLKQFVKTGRDELKQDADVYS